MIYLFVGLGNPGTKYKNTRHNVGFLVLNYFVNNSIFNKNNENNELKNTILQNSLFKNENKFSAEIFSTFYNNQKLIFAKPQTFMNDSGKSIISIKNFYKPQKIIIIHDDLDITFGKIKLSKGNNEAGHNGLKSISSNIGKNYIKLRIGISRPKYNSKNYVLSNFSEKEFYELKTNVLPMAQNIIIDIIDNGFTKAQNKWNSKK
jgi:PTH1 family peptidyl-tRNA hydrolase